MGLTRVPPCTSAINRTFQAVSRSQTPGFDRVLCPSFGLFHAIQISSEDDVGFVHPSHSKIASWCPVDSSFSILLGLASIFLSLSFKEVPRAELNILWSFVHSLFIDFSATTIRLLSALEERVAARNVESLGRKVPLLSRLTRSRLSFHVLCDAV